jgi:antitoxin MazE
MKVARWGNSLAVRLPRSLIEEMGLKDGDEVDITVAGTRQLDVSRDPRRDEALARIKAMRVALPPGYKFDRGELYERHGVSPDPDSMDES